MHARLPALTASIGAALAIDATIERTLGEFGNWVEAEHSGRVQCTAPITCRTIPVFFC